MSGPGRRRPAGRQLAAAVGATALAGGLALSSSGQSWARVTVVRPLPLPAVTTALSGGQAAPLVPAMGLLLLAAAVALVALRARARAAVGAVVLAAGGALAWSAARVLGGRVDPGAGGLPVVPAVPGGRPRTELTGWPALAVAAGVIALAVGVLVLLRGRGWPTLGRRYERGAAAGRPPETAEDRAAAAWRALDRGEDPTGAGGSSKASSDEASSDEASSDETSSSDAF